MAEFTGYILAGGKSSRMGADKAFLKIGAKTFLENAVEILNPVCERVKVVLNKSQDRFIEKIPGGVPHIFDIYENRGALGGMHAALKDCATKFAVILAVDLPLVTPGAIEKLAALARAANKRLACIPRQADEKPQPLCAVYRADHCLSPLEKILGETNSASVRNFLETIAPRYVNAENLSANENLFLNTNYPGDLDKLK